MGNFSMKLASAVTTATLVATSLAPAVTSAASEFLPYADALANNKVINQNTEAGYRLNDNITRAELAKVAANLGQFPKVACTGKVYTDVKSTLGDLCEAIETLASAKVVSSASLNFRPTDLVTRAEMTKMILGALGETPSAVSAGYADVDAKLGDLEGFINRAAEKGVVNKATYFRPNAHGTRGEVFKIASNAAGLKTSTPTTSTGTTLTGSVSVTSVGSAVAQYVPKNASSVKVGTVEITAKDGDVTLNSLTVTRSGLGDPKDIASSNGIRASIDGKIVSSAADYYNYSSQQANVLFVPALTLKKGESKKVDILVSLNTDAQSNSQHQFTVTSVTANNTAVATSATLGLISTTSYTTGNVNINLANKVSELKPGTKDQRVVSVRVQPTDRDINLSYFAIARNNTAAGNVNRPATDLARVFANAKAFINGTEVGKVAVTADKIFVTGINKDLKVGTTTTFDIRSDILLDGVNNGVSLQIEDSSDLGATEKSTGQMVRVNNNKDIVTIFIKNVNNTFVNTNSTRVTVAPGTDNVAFYDAKLSSSVPVIVKKLIVTPTLVSGDVAQNVSTSNPLRVKVNGLEVAQIDKIIQGTSTGVTTSFIVDEPTSAQITIEGNLNSDAKTGKLRFKVEAKEIEDMSRNSATLQATVREGVDVEISNGTVNVYSVYGSTTANVISASSVVDMGSFEIFARNQDIKVKQIGFKANTDDAITQLSDIVDTTNEQNVEVYLDGNMISGKAVVKTNNIEFTPNNEIYISKDAKKKVTLKIRTKDIATAAFGKKLGYKLDATTTEIYAQNVDAISANKITVSEVALASSDYTVGITAPIVTAVKRIEGTNIAVVTVENADADKNIKVDALKLAITARGKDANFTNAVVNLKSENNTASITTAGAVNGAVYVFDTKTISRELTRNARQDFYVELSGVVPDDTVVLTVKEVTYRYNKADNIAAVNSTDNQNATPTVTLNVVAK